MTRTRRLLVSLLMALSLGFLMGDDCEFEWEGGFPFPVIGYRPYVYDYVVVEEVYYSPFFPFW